MLRLYVKTHKTTGLKYLGKTNAEDAHKYPGSGSYWKNHLKIHGKNYDTEILLETEDPEEIKKWGAYYSSLWNIVESGDWANLKPENGDGGWESANSNPDVISARIKRNKENPPMKRPEVVAKITGDNHPRRKNPELFEKLNGNNHWTKRPDTNYTPDKNPMKRPEVVEKVIAAISGDNHYSKQPGYTAKNHPMKKDEHRKRQADMVRGDNSPSRREDLKVICEGCGVKTTRTAFTRFHKERCSSK